MKKTITLLLSLFSLAVSGQNGGTDHFKLKTDVLEAGNLVLETAKLPKIITPTVLTIDGSGNVGYATSGGANLWESDPVKNYVYYDIGLGDMRIGNETDLPEDQPDLYASGKIYTTEVIVQATVPVPDYVFEKDYQLKPLEEVEKFINKNKHLPEIPSAKEVGENGLNLSEMNLLLLKKVEELTLYMIEQQKEIEALKKQITQN